MTAVPSRARLSTRRTRWSAAAAATGLAVAGLLATAPGASAAPTTVSNATLFWGLSAEASAGAPALGCNFLSAGTAGNTGASRPWTESDGFFHASAGQVAVQKPNAAGVFGPTSWGSKCVSPNGVPVTTGVTTGSRVVFSAGSGSVDPATGTATISWTGSFTSAFYGGAVYWSAADPVLTVANGRGVLRATLSGYGADRANASTWTPIAGRSVVIATLTNVAVGAGGLVVAPDYRGVRYDAPSDATQQQRTGPDWGSFPAAFADFQQLTGQSSYWYSTASGSGPTKVAAPLTVSYGSAPIVPATPTSLRLTASAATSVAGAKIRLTAAVGPTTATGVVTFTDGSKLLGRAAVVRGASSIVTAALLPGPHSLRATFAPTAAAWGASTATPVRHAVVKAKAAASLRFVDATITRATRPKVRVTVSLKGSTLAATGRVKVTEGTRTLATGTVVKGRATVVLPKLSVGRHKVKVVYLGSAAATAATSAARTVAVRRP